MFSSKFETYGSFIATRCNKMRSAESRKEIIEGDLIRQILNCKPQRQAGVLIPHEEIVRSNAEIEHISGRHARRIVVVVQRARRRNSESRRTKVRGATLDTMVHRSPLISAEEPDCGLLRCRKPQCIVESSDSSCHKSAVISPGVCGPGAIAAPLVPQTRGLLKCLVMVNAEYGFRKRRVEQELLKELSAKRALCMSQA
jgi:hypothetical protein